MRAPRITGVGAVAASRAVALWVGVAAALTACEGATNLGGVEGIGPLPKADKVDILLALDNSRSMADKQQILGLALTDLVQELVNPRCVAEGGAPVSPQPPSPAAPCPDGSARRHAPVTDIHLGVVTSSLGGRGSDACALAGGANPSSNDRGRLVARTDPGVDGVPIPTYADKGFLAWDPGGNHDPPGESDPAAFSSTFKEMVNGVGQLGCGYEAQLESWYRFLADPEPYEFISVPGGVATPEGIDGVLLQQRADFLRPDSLLAIVLLSDENDCSIREEGQYFYALQQNSPNGTKFRLPAPRAECAEDPNDPCCLSCGQERGTCPEDPGCTTPEGTVRALSEIDDHINLRCFDQKRRFGIDFLYPTTRYIGALTSAMVTNRAGELVRNPIFSDLNPSDDVTRVRDPGLVVLAGIVGVPWQDLARSQDLAQGFKSAQELTEPLPGGGTTWDVILGDPARDVPPLDPFMIESIDARSGVNPITGDAITPPGTLNPINGSDWTIHNRGDVQYACVFPLGTPRDCSSAVGTACDCDPDTDSGLCAPNPDDNGKMTLQVRAKAYPGLRELAVLKGIGAQGVTTSICPKQTTDPLAADYGYRPALRALLDRMASRL